MSTLVTLNWKPAPSRRRETSDGAKMLEHSPDTATCLLDEIQEILRRWEYRVRSTVAASEAEHGWVLQNNFAAFLTELATELSHSVSQESPTHPSAVAQEHGRLRALLPAYTLGDVLREYRLLRQTILEVVAERGEIPPEGQERIVDAIEQAMEAAGSQYALVLFEAERQRGQEARLGMIRLTNADQARVEATALLVHDLRSPLTCLLVGLETLETSDHLNASEHELVNIAVSGGRSLLGMINDILDISKSDSGKLTLSYCEIAAGALIDTALEELAPLALQKGVTLERETLRDLPPFQGDEDKLHRTLVNLVGNAIKFTPSAGKIRVQADLDPGGAVVFSVQDTGEGIAEEDLNRIFDSFVQANTRSGRKASSGLGLRFCRMVVEAHGGRIEVSSQFSKGSTFRFAIPLSRPIRTL